MAFSATLRDPVRRLPMNKFTYRPVERSHSRIGFEMTHGTAQDNARRRVGDYAALTIGLITHPPDDVDDPILAFPRTHAQLAGSLGQKPSAIVAGARVRTAVAAKGHPNPLNHFRTILPSDGLYARRGRNLGLDYDN